MREKAKICIIHYSSPPVIGGVEFIIEAQAQVFTDYGYAVKIITGRGESFDKRIELKIIPEINSLPKWEKLLDKKNYQSDAKIIYKKLREEIKKIDICIIHNCLTMPFNIPLTIALHRLIEEENSIKFISWCHDSIFLDPTYKNFVAGINKGSFPWILLRTPLKKVNYVAISKTQAKGFAHLFNLKLAEIKVIPDGINLEKFLNLTSQALYIFKKFKLFLSDIIFLIPARLIKRKNIELAIKITKAINEKGIEAKTIITGPPDPHKKSSGYFPSLKKLVKDLGINDKIIFLYEVKEQKTNKRIKVGLRLLQDLYLFSDILLLPSYQEGFGIPLLEAGLFRLPIFSANIPPLKELGGKEINYFTLKESPERIAARILKFYQQNKTLKMFKKILRGYTWEFIFEKNIEPYLKSSDR